ncbi:DNA helicase [Bacillus phage vB_BsuM-Goe3]|uniref:Recombination helicase n=1 Tax=Bacillus phage vB_BsuM-Goe3 TaxID=1933063 RepID=A0A217ER52_BPGO3|nr:DNA helicase [Bacillus phage vB_BsuM-Goe3]APZ82563.1 recombination helicase [Bacillus phage vB_BsuM-Goe3]
MRIIVDTMYTTVDFKRNTLLREKVQKMAHRELGVKVDNAQFSRAYQSGVWDGITDFYDMKEDKFHTGLLTQFLEGLRKLKDKDPSLTYEIEDIRPAQLVHPDSIDEEIVLGNGENDPITLRDYQYESVRNVFRDQVGIVNVATNGGKTEIASGFMQQVLPYLKRGERIAFFTHSKEILHQSADRIMARLNLKPRDIGKIGDGKFDVKNKKIVFVMVPTLVSSLKDPKKGIKFTAKERVIKMIAEDVAPKFRNTKNTRQLLRNYIKNCSLKTQVWQSAEEQLMYIAYDNKFTDRTAQLQLNKYIAEFDKIMEKKNKNKYKRYKDTIDFLDSIKVMIADEVHHSKADTWFSSLSLCGNAVYRVGLTGTVDKKDKMGWQRLQAIFAQVVVKVSNEFLIEKGISSKPTIRLLPVVEPRNIELVNTYLEAYKLGIVENETRNKMIADLVQSYKKRRPGGVLVSVKEIEHGNKIQEMLSARGLESAFIHGGSESDHRAGQLEKFSKGETGILIASTIIDEGVDMKSIGCMVLAAGGKSMRQQLQRIGRGLRLNGIDGNSVMVFDFYDQTNKYLRNHSNERLKIFKEEKFDVKIMQ